jgi:hypothetical protein
LWIIRLANGKYECTRGSSKNIQRAAVYEKFSHAKRGCKKGDKVLKVKLSVWGKDE